MWPLTSNKRERPPVDEMRLPSSWYVSVLQLILKVRGQFGCKHKTRPIVLSRLGFAMPFPRSIRRARSSPSLGTLLQQKAHPHEGRVRQLRPLFFVYTLRVPLEVLRYTFLLLPYLLETQHHI